MLKNIIKLRTLGIEPKKQWLVPELYSAKIPTQILDALGLPRVGDLSTKRSQSSQGRSQTKKISQMSTVNNDDAEVLNVKQTGNDLAGVPHLGGTTKNSS